MTKTSNGACDMTLTRRMDRQGLVTTSISGTITTVDWLRAIRDLGEDAPEPGELWEIVVFSPSARISRHAHASLELVHSAKEAIQFKSRGAIAIYSPSNETREWAEEIAALLRGDNVPVVVFADESDARKWIEIHQGTARYHATTRIARHPAHHSSPLH